jgi:protein involved in polysaccharide export with SLBB domain
MTTNNRQSLRIPHRVDVKLMSSSLGHAVCEMKNFSETGMYLKSNDETEIALGDKVEVQTLEFDGAPVVEAEVVRIDSEGFAVEFMDAY